MPGDTGVPCWVSAINTRTGGCMMCPCSEVSGSMQTRGHWGRGKPKQETEGSLSLPTGSQLSARATDGSPCSVLLCSVVPTRRLDSVTWMEGKGPVRGHVQSFWGNGAALLLVCPGDGPPEHRGRRPRIIHCLIPQNKGVSFSLAGKLSGDMGRDVPSGTSTPAG